MTKINQLREQILIFMAHKIGLPYFKLVRRKPSFPYTREQLASLPEGTVGQQLHQFFKANELDLLPFYEKHDIKHVVLGYDATEDGEVCLQCFMLANGRCTIPVLIAVIYGVLTMPEYWSKFKQAWKRGRSNQSLGSVNWFDLIPQPTETVQKALLQSKAAA
ncbi:Coq4 family protein [Edaphocola aurantiacus]|jgi:ubiquinone biosynthesis protein Coq4|uniref:Coq4 family protein n=1 Tax=Edaphocola aurantiacus TaxID=2601682 RepID=UPI001C98D186|nr:Coq4 family protein [Edaphocola aurantiacus]